MRNVLTFIAPFFVVLSLAGPAFSQDGGVDGGLVDGGTDAGDVDAGDIDAGDIDAGDVDAGDVDAGDVDAGDVDAGDVDAGDVDAGDADAGEVDAGFDCPETCDGDVLVFCDGTNEVRIDCADEGARCGLLDDTWGRDCLLSQGAECIPGYAEGRSRCDRDQNLTCVVDVCAPCEDAECNPVFGPAPVAPLTSGDTPTVPGDSADALSCLGCTNTPTLPFLSLFVMALSLRLRRRRSSPSNA